MKDQELSSSPDSVMQGSRFLSNKKESFKKDISTEHYAVLCRFKKKTLTCKNVIQNESNPDISKLIV